MEKTTQEFVSGQSPCLFDSHAACNRLWVSQADGLHPAYFQTEQVEMGPGSRRSSSGDAGLPVIHSNDCEHCNRHNSGAAAAWLV
jgi:hypothetical protein